jgi:hypothetical protein
MPRWGFVAHRVVILSMLVKKNNVPDGSIFDTLWRIFLHLLAHFLRHVAQG